MAAAQDFWFWGAVARAGEGAVAWTMAGAVAPVGAGAALAVRVPWRGPGRVRWRRLKTPAPPADYRRKRAILTLT